MSSELADDDEMRILDAATGSGSLFDSVLGYNGERKSNLLGGYHLGNGYRVYSPILRRFTSPDNMSPFGRGGINPYAYCAGDPINNIDPTGHFSIFGFLWNLLMGGADIATDGMAAPAEALGEGAIELHNAARSAEEAGKALNAVAEEKHMKSASDEFLLYRPTKNKRTMRPFDDSALPINLHPANGKPTDFYKLFEPLPPEASHPMPIGRTRPEFYLTEDATGYTSNFMGTGNPGIMLHGGHGGMLSGMVNMNLDGEGEREHCTGEAEAILQHLSSQHRLELWDSNKPLHLAACHIGGQRDTIAELSSSMQRPVITYGSGRIAFHNGFKDALSFQKTEIAEVISENHYVLLEETWHPVDRLI